MIESRQGVRAIFRIGWRAPWQAGLAEKFQHVGRPEFMHFAPQAGPPVVTGDAFVAGAIDQDLALALFDKMCAKHGLFPVHPDKLLIRDGALRISQGDLPLYVDDDHLSRLGSEPLVQEILRQLSL